MHASCSADINLSKLICQALLQCAETLSMLVTFYNIIWIILVFDSQAITHTMLTSYSNWNPVYACAWERSNSGTIERIVEYISLSHMYMCEIN